MISRFMDNELHGDDLLAVRGHVESCESCRNRLDAYGKISTSLNSLLSAETARLLYDTQAGVIYRERQKSSWLKVLKEIVLPGRRLIPAGVAVSIVLAAMMFLHRPAPSGPSAIISSISLTGVNTIIYETPESRQTILWIEENG